MNAQASSFELNNCGGYCFGYSRMYVLVNVESTKRNVGLSVETEGYHLPPNLALILLRVLLSRLRHIAHLVAGLDMRYLLKTVSYIVQFFFNNFIAFTCSSISRGEAHTVCQRCMVHCIDM